MAKLKQITHHRISLNKHFPKNSHLTLRVDRTDGDRWLRL
jgi:hypothetical protein